MVAKKLGYKNTNKKTMKRKTYGSNDKNWFGFRRGGDRLGKHSYRKIFKSDYSKPKKYVHKSHYEQSEGENEKIKKLEKKLMELNARMQSQNNQDVNDEEMDDGEMDGRGMYDQEMYDQSVREWIPEEYREYNKLPLFSGRNILSAVQTSWPYALSALSAYLWLKEKYGGASQPEQVKK